jgi:hypothetical protein
LTVWKVAGRDAMEPLTCRSSKSQRTERGMMNFYDNVTKGCAFGALGLSTMLDIELAIFPHRCATLEPDLKVQNKNVVVYLRNTVCRCRGVVNNDVVSLDLRVITLDVVV